MEQTTPANVANHLRNNQDHYAKVEHRLWETRDKFYNSDVYGRVDMLQKAHAFAVLSIQTPVHIHEQAYINLFDSPETIDGAIDSTNYYKNKATYIKESFENRDTWRQVSRLLARGNIDEAHKYIVDNIRGVSTTKAAFMLAMLGYMQKMCLDTNICNLYDVDRSKTVVVEKYEEQCDNIMDKAPTLSSKTNPFMFQWISFDYKRGTVTSHDVWFESVGVE